jgi:two-component system, OmpR family, phosphate regulon sensor histidine kinase PhoR
MLKKPYIISLIFFISLSVMGLIIIQIYWIRNALNLKEEQFKQNVSLALTEVASELERFETIRSIRSHSVGKQILHDIDSLTRTKQPLLTGNPRYSLRDTVIIGEDNINIKVTEKVREDTIEGFITRSKIVTKSIGRENEEDEIFDFNIGIDGTKSFSQDAKIYLDAGLDDFNKDRLIQRSELVNDLIQDLVRKNVLQDIKDRITFETLDSIISNEFILKGIDTEFKYCVFDAQDEPVIYDKDCKGYFDNIYNSGYKTLLFPHDIIREPNYLKVYFPNKRGYLYGSIWVMLAISLLLTLIIIFAFSYTIFTILRQKKISLIKNDFINNMTHEFKTPIATVSLACEALSDPAMVAEPSRYEKFLKMIKEENKRLSILVESILQTAVLDKGNIQLRKENIDLHQICNEAINNIMLQIDKKQGKLTTSFGAENPLIIGDRIHILNMVYNLLDNAVKYSPQNPEIVVKTKNIREGILLIVKDNGIGMSKEHLKKIFDNLYRIPTGDLHDVKGFGLGLSYVRKVLIKHKGEINVTSEKGKGSEFSIYIPHDFETVD